VLAEAQEEKLIAALIQDDMASVLRGYNADPSELPPFDQRLRGRLDDGQAADRAARNGRRAA
jgi:hypothetical protein